jgi:CheY-like chemotaxis protein
MLLVDDVEDVRNMYETYLHFQGVRVTTAASGEEALESIALERPDVVVLDLAMPKITGWDVLRQLKSARETRAITVLVLSGQDAEPSALAAGADGYLEKPCRPDRLLAEALRLLREPPKRRDDH